ncbi:hypothetical protein PHYPSEUDO_006981 [Phytophthora pseudosyringae]|uniref:Uncharacterized protein n=1 Tax=Phytophthora pseudosyringae TaxID=221518 RepID=A0A8T1VKD3_9STRA|nr:hypothetical protein PHYPSEUDO_006981 [Phytophthora pseudosyringae]
MSKRDYFLQKGLQMQRLDEQISSAPAGDSASREVTKYRELCPPGTPDTQIQKLIGQCKGDAQRMENAISELWEDYRGNDQDDAWATVAKKSTKKKHVRLSAPESNGDVLVLTVYHALFFFIFVGCPMQEQSLFSSQRSNSSKTTQHQQDDHADAPQDGDAQPPRSAERFSTRGRGSMRGRGTASSRGGRGGRGGRGRGGAVVATGSTRGPRNGDNEEESPENESNSTDGSSPSNVARVQQSSKTAKDSKRDRGAKPVSKTTTTQPAAQAPPVVYPVLTGAWTKKLNVSSATSTSKPVEPAPTSAPAAAPKPAEKPIAPAKTETEAAAVTATPEAPKTASPKKKAQQDKKSKKTQKPGTTEAAEETAAVVGTTETVKTVAKAVSPKASPKKTVEKKKTKTVETTVETTSSNIGAGWGTLDVSTSTMDEWSSSATATEPKKASTPNAWARGSPVLSPPASKKAAPAPKSPVAEARPTVVPGSPKDIDVPRSTGTTSTSPRPYLKMGKWDSAATPNLSLQFGSFSLNGMDSVEPSSPVGWASAATATTTSNSNNGIKTVTKTTTTQSAWGTTTKSASPKKSLSPDRTEKQHQRTQEGAVAKATTSAPPGLSVDSGRVTPTTGQSPRYAPSAPSPASLPKPDEVKRGTPTRAQGGPFQAQGGAATQANKMNIGYGTGLYQASYGQYSMDLGRPAAASTPGQLPAGSGTPKSAGVRGAAAAQVAVQSPSLGPQPVAQMQQIPLQQQAQQQQQQQQQVQQQTQQKQSQQQQTQQPQQSQPSQTQQQTAAQMHQQAQAGMQQGYHYAPPPPPGMALPYNPYNYAGYYQGYGYYQNPQFAQYSPRTQYPPRGSMPYGVEGPVPGFSNPPNMPYQDQHMMAQQHEYAGAVPQGFGEINAAYMQQAPMQQQGGHHHGHQNGPQGHGKGGSSSSATGSGSQQAHGQRSNAGMPAYQNAGGRDHASPPVPNASAAMTGSYGQHYGWAGNYGAQPVGGWGHMMPQGYQQSPSQQQQASQQQQQQQQQQPNAHQQSYHQYGNGGAQAGNSSNDANPARWSSS